MQDINKSSPTWVKLGNLKGNLLNENKSEERALSGGVGLKHDRMHVHFTRCVAHSL